MADDSTETFTLTPPKPQPDPKPDPGPIARPIARPIHLLDEQAREKAGMPPESTTVA